MAEVIQTTTTTTATATATATATRTLFLPYEILYETGYVTGYDLNEYPVDITTSLRGVETRTLLPGGKSGGKISMTMKNVDDIAHETLIQFYDLCKGSHLAFEIRSDHQIWIDMMPAFLKNTFYPLWRFDGRISGSCNDPQACMWDVSISLLNVAI